MQFYITGCYATTLMLDLCVSGGIHIISIETLKKNKIKNKKSIETYDNLQKVHIYMFTIHLL